MPININTRHFKVTILIAVTFFYSGCKKFVQIDPPSAQIVTASVFDDNNAATAALTNIYIAMQQESWNMSQNTGLLSDELQSLSTSNLVRPYYQNALLANISSNFGPWTNAYNYIYQANAVISGVRVGAGLSAAVKKQLIGEAELIRAFWYFYLVNCYGDVPLVTTTDYTLNRTLSRTDKTEIYRQVINDLKDAKELLNSNYVDGSDTALSPERIRPNKAAASALLARVYLYTNDYPNAEIEANTVLSNGQYKLVGDLNGVFLMNSAEAIWQLGVPSPSGYSTADGYNFILTSAPASGDAIDHTATISSYLWNSFEPMDQRKSNWIGSITTTGPDNTYYFPYKYKSNGLPVTEYTMLLRLAEQYLIHAEALTRQDKNLIQAVADIDSLRRRAGLEDYTGPLTKDTLLTTILHERQVELFTEWGHRWFDLIRTGNVNAVMSVVTPQKGGVWRPEWKFFPIPESERMLDYNLGQNDGY
jgi:hypothetical protein